jgi:hypothetical protein
VGVDKTNQLITVSFRGTESVQNELDDAETTLETISTCSGCTGFTGIYNSWAEVKSNITTAVGQALAANPGFRVLTTGHSLGAGIATFAAAELRNSGFIVDMVSPLPRF